MLITTLGGCAPADVPEPAGAALALVDASGARVELPAHPTRVVSLVPAATSVIVALGGTAQLVGRTDFDTATAVAQISSVGGGLSPSLETIVSLEPDLVVRFAGDTDLLTPSRLDDLGIPHFAVQPERIDDIRAMIDDLAALLDREEVGSNLLAELDAALDQIRARSSRLEPVRVAFVMAGDPPWVAGPATYVGELLALAGAVNVFQDLRTPWGAVSPEAIVAREVDLFVLPRGVELDPRLIGRARVTYVSADVLLPGPELGNAAFEIARAIRPDVFE